MPFVVIARQTPLLVSILKEYSGTAPLSFYAVYTQSDKAAWAKYAISHFGGIENPQVRVYNLWDPEGVSEFHKKYSVLSTPSLLLLDADNRIIGRRLDAAALPKYYHWGKFELFGLDMLISRTGYTGELGFELYFDAAHAVDVWRKLLACPGVKRWTCIDPKPDMLSLRTSFQSHLNVSAGASASPQAAMS